MRHTLEELKAMSDEQLTTAWRESAFPFDKAICGGCLLHHQDYSLAGCTHEAMRAQMEKLPTIYTWGKYLRPHLEELYALRLFYDSLYPQPEPTFMEGATRLNAVLEDALSRLGDTPPTPAEQRMEEAYHNRRSGA